MATKLKKGERWTTKDRLWAVVNEDGHIIRTISGGKVILSIFGTRGEARAFQMQDDGDRIVRLSDLHGEVV